MTSLQRLRKLFFFLGIWTINCLANEVCFYALEEVESWDWNHLYTTERHSVYYNEDFYCKIWGEDSERCSHFYTLYEKGIFREIAPLTALIFDIENLCRGYITSKCEPLVPGVDFTPSPHTEALNYQIKQPKELTLFLHKFAEIFDTTGYLVADTIKRINLGKRNGRYYFFDLDDAYTVEQLRERVDQELVDLYLKNYAKIHDFYLEYCDQK